MAESCLFFLKGGRDSTPFSDFQVGKSTLVNRICDIPDVIGGITHDEAKGMGDWR